MTRKRRFLAKIRKFFDLFPRTPWHLGGATVILHFC